MACDGILNDVQARIREETLRHLRPLALLVLLLCAGCVDIPLTDTSKTASAMTKPLRVGMTPDQVHAAMGKPDYAERFVNWLGVQTDQVQEVYERSVDAKHFYIQLIVIACGNHNGVEKTADSYRILVRYDRALRVAAFEVVPFWAHPRDYNAAKVPIPQ